MAVRIVTLLSDFGLRDPYVAEMKAVILGMAPKTRIVDISHQIEKFNVRMGAFILSCAAPFFPDGTVHVAVVDPEVGVKRNSIIIETKRSFFVGPDNGLLSLAAAKNGIRGVYKIASTCYVRKPVSKTFHGRDVFAPIAACLVKGEKPQNLGSKTTKYVVLEFAETSRRGDRFFGEILHVDDFGNVVTSFTAGDIEKTGLKEGETFTVVLGVKEYFMRLCSSYAEVRPNQPLAIVGSHGFLEISVNQGSAAKMFMIKPGDSVQIFLG